MIFAAPAALLSAVLLFANVDARIYCTNREFGDSTGRSVQLSPIPLPRKSNHVYIQDTCFNLGPYYKSVGIKVVACDSMKPLVIVNRLDHAFVRLWGIPRSAVAYVTQYCRSTAYRADSEEDDSEEVPYDPTSIAIDHRGQYDD